MTAGSRVITVLAGDVGGTKTNLGLFSMVKGRLRILAAETYASPGARGLASLVEGFPAAHQVTVSAACFGVPGPVSGGRTRTTNLPWTVSETSLKSRFAWDRVFLINDLMALAWGIETLKKGETSLLTAARLRPSQTRAVVAPGTGLGVSFLISHGDALIPMASEGGHVDFAPSDEDEWDLWRFVQRRFGHVSVERILSGPGIALVYAWLRDSGRFEEPPALARQIKREDPSAVIAEDAMRGGTPICRETLRRFSSILGAFAGNVALTAMATGGVYLGGGIPPKILPLLRESAFQAAFQNKGRFRTLMEKIGVRVILNERTALQGAARFAFEQIQ